LLGTGGTAPVAPYVITAPSLYSAQEAVAGGYTSGTYGGTPTPTLASRQWTLNGSAVSGATGATFAPIVGTAGESERATEVYSNSAGSVTGTSNAVTVLAAASFGNRMVLGMNVNAFTNISPNEPDGALVNLAQASYPVQDPNNGYAIMAANLLAANGMPTVDFCLPIFTYTSTASATSYTITFPGKATVGFRSTFSIGATIVSNTPDSPTAGTSTVIMSVPAGTAAQANLQLLFTATQITDGAATGTGLSALDIRLTSDVGSTHVWTTPYINYLSPFKILRTMDLTGANNDFSTTTWASRNQSVLTSSKFEDAISLAAQAGCAVWICIPTLATTDFVTGLTNYIKTNFPSLIWYPEFSNERWNP